jgi:hypothetical protein
MSNFLISGLVHYPPAGGNDHTLCGLSMDGDRDTVGPCVATRKPVDCPDCLRIVRYCKRLKPAAPEAPSAEVAQDARELAQDWGIIRDCLKLAHDHASDTAHPAMCAEFQLGIEALARLASAREQGMKSVTSSTRSGSSRRS